MPKDWAGQNLMRKYIYYDYYENTTALFYAYTSDEITNHLGLGSPLISVHRKEHH